MKTTEIIKLWDNEKYDYPLIEIDKEHTDDFLKCLYNYRNGNDEYNCDDFFKVLKKQKWFVRTIKKDTEVFF